MQVLKIIRKFSNKSKIEWYNYHTNDQFVKKARQLNYRSRAAFKLSQIDQKFNILKQNSQILDLGCNPGGWSQFLLKNYKKMKIVGIDIIKMEYLHGVDFYHGDARDQKLTNTIKQKYNEFDTIISDMAPNFSGVGFETHQEIIQLNKICLFMSSQMLKQDGNLVMKCLQGQYQKQYFFKNVKRFKPKASRNESSQFFLVCKEFDESKREKLKSILNVDFKQSYDKKCIINRFDNIN